jgi:hypothetical protein
MAGGGGKRHPEPAGAEAGKRGTTGNEGIGSVRRHRSSSPCIGTVWTTSEVPSIGTGMSMPTATHATHW